jgi:hypothetical protein
MGCVFDSGKRIVTEYESGYMPGQHAPTAAVSTPVDCGGPNGGA